MLPFWPKIAVTGGAPGRPRAATRRGGDDVGDAKGRTTDSMVISLAPKATTHAGSILVRRQPLAAEFLRAQRRSIFPNRPQNRICHLRMRLESRSCSVILSPSSCLHHACGFCIAGLPADMQRRFAVLNVIVARNAHTCKCRLGITHRLLEVCYLPHGQGFRPRCERDPNGHAAMPQGRAAEKLSSFKTNIHGEQD